MGQSRETEVVRLTDKDELRDLLDRYAVGSLYMAEAVAPQGESANGS
jgi:hypothetical protein